MLMLLSAALLSSWASALLIPCVTEDRTPRIGRRAALSGAGALLVPAASWGSGGATAGKTTSIPRAKTRYFARITTAVQEFELLKALISKNDAAAKEFFAGEESPYEEFKGAGFLLAAAFKIDSKIPPDKVAQVKMQKALVKDLDGLKNAIGSKSAVAAYDKTCVSLGTYLEGVELPPLGDGRYDPDVPPRGYP